MSKIRILIVDDSAFMRKALRMMLGSDAELEIVDAAVNGKEAVAKTLQHKPDLVTMDVEMPVMDGIESLKQIMEKQPTPVLMVSSLTTQGAQATIDAMSNGAVDFIPKPSMLASEQMKVLQQDLVQKIKAIAKSSALKMRLRKTRSVLERLEQRSKGIESSATAKPLTTPKRAVVNKKGRFSPSTIKMAIIGVSTGGPLALHELIPRLPKKLPVPLLIVQHMPKLFTKSLSDRLNDLSPLTVHEAADGMELKPGNVYVAPGGQQMLIKRDGRHLEIVPGAADILHKPSVNVTADSIREHVNGNVLCVIMTGMGRDGCDAYQRMKQDGKNYILAQDEKSCVVYGMPKAVVDAGIADEIHPLDHLADEIASCFGLQAEKPH